MTEYELQVQVGLYDIRIAGSGKTSSDFHTRSRTFRTFFQVIARPREWKSRDESPKTLEYQDDPSLRSDNQRPKECGKELQKYIFMYATALSSRFLKSEDGHISPNQV